jgi:AcrR family transcriptional regulator
VPGEIHAAAGCAPGRARSAATARSSSARGYGGTTIDAVAQAAGVSRKTVFTAVGGKVELIKLAYDFAVAGDDEPVPMPERPAVRALVAEDDPARMLAAYAVMVADIGARIAPVYVALQGAAQTDPAARRCSKSCSSNGSRLCEGRPGCSASGGAQAGPERRHGRGHLVDAQ